MALNLRRKYKRLARQGKNSKVVSFTKNKAGKINKATVMSVLVVLFGVTVVTAIYLYNKYNRYDDYKVLKTVDIQSGESSKYVSFGDFVAKYSSNGISYIDGEETVWDEAHEMKAPMVDVCQDYLAIADKDTNDIAIYSRKGREGSVTTSYPIKKVEIAKQGVVAALLEDKQANYIEVFDKEGNTLVSHKALLDENGYPINFSLSDDGTKMIVSYVTVNKGTIDNKVVFYNFSRAGRNAEDRVVGEFKQYEESIVPAVSFVTNTDAIAVGEDVVSIYKMKAKPKLKNEFSIKDEIDKVFYNEEYIGLVFKNSNNKSPYRVEVYTFGGNRILKKNVDLSIDNITFSGDNILMYNDLNCEIISLKGIVKFEYTFKSSMSAILPVDGGKTYLFMTNSEIQKVKLK